jgi:hypothetical protein
MTVFLSIYIAFQGNTSQRSRIKRVIRAESWWWRDMFRTMEKRDMSLESARFLITLSPFSLL